MKLQGTMDIKADRDRVFAFLTTPEKLGPCLPRVQSVRMLSNGRFEAHAKVGKGFLSASFVLECTFTEVRAPERAAIRATGKAKGSAVDGTAQMTLRELSNGGTAVDWTADVTVTGLVARLGASRLEGAAQRMIAQTLKCARKQLKGG